MTQSNIITLRIFLPTRQLSKLVDCWVNLNGERARGLQGCRQYQKTGAWISKRAKFVEGRRERATATKRTRIAVCEDRWGDNSRCGKCQCAKGHSVCASPRVVTLGSVSEKPCMGPCVAVLCVNVDTVRGMLQGNKTAFILQQTSLLHEKCRVKPKRSRKWRQTE